MTTKIYKEHINGIPYEIRKMKQAKRISLKIAQDGRVWISMPHYASLRLAQEFIQQHVSYLHTTLEHIQQKQQAQQDRALTLPFRGQWLQVKIETAAQPDILVNMQEMILTIQFPACPQPDQHRIQALYYWQLHMRKKAENDLPQRTLKLAAGVGETVRRVSVRDQKSRWGSCSKNRRSISLNWRCILFPDPVRDYLLYHELAHLRHPNHSSRYWQQVEQWVPDYREAERWITKNGRAIMAINEKDLQTEM